MKIVIVSGGFDPIHSGHISYLKEAKSYGDRLIVALNSDAWLKKKKGKSFMPFLERKEVIENIKFVDQVVDFEDDDFGSAINAIEKIKLEYPNEKILFANGGDRDKSNIPEMSVNGVDFIFEIGGKNKKNSSSWILKNWQYFMEERVWGKFYNLFEDDGVKVKELIVEPKSGMSFQRHYKRNEIWLISRGSCVVNYSDERIEKKKSITLKKFDQYNVLSNEWHQITNPFNEACHIIEIQFGEIVDEDDIERAELYQPK